MAETMILMTPEELFEKIKTLKVGERIDIARDISDSIVSGNIVKGGEGWFGIIRIDLDIFCDEGAFVLESYGGGDARIIAYREDPDDMEYALLDLKQYLEEKELLQTEYEGRVAVECEMQYVIIVRKKEE